MWANYICSVGANPVRKAIECEEFHRQSYDPSDVRGRAFRLASTKVMLADDASGDTNIDAVVDSSLPDSF